MQATYYIDVSVQTAEGPKQFARFELGHHREAAYGLFRKLEGSSVVDQKDMIYIEFMEMVNGLPLNLDILTCDLQELGTNAMLITQEVFRLENFKTGL